MLSGNDREYLRDIAKRTAELAASDEHKGRVARYKAINSLRVVRPPLAVHLPPDAQKQLIGPPAQRITDAEYAWIERDLLTEQNRALRIPSDVPVTAVLHTGLFCTVSDWMEGYQPVRAKPDGTTSRFEPCIKEYSDLHKLRKPTLTVDHKATSERFERTNDLLGDILDIRAGSPFSMTCGWGESMIDQFAEMRGLEQLYFDMLDEPGFVHEAMEIMTACKLSLLEDYVQQRALYINNDRYTIGSCSYPFTDELPGPDFDPHHVRPSDLWGYAQAQELTGVSPEMLDSFVLPYQARILRHFGLCSYGCCEPMDRNIHLIAKHIPNLRILSISPYSDINIAAEQCMGRYVMAVKLHPGLISSYHPDVFERELRRIIPALSGCCGTINFAEIMDFGADAQVFVRAATMVKQVIDECWGPTPLSTF